MTDYSATSIGFENTNGNCASRMKIHPAASQHKRGRQNLSCPSVSAVSSRCSQSTTDHVTPVKNHQKHSKYNQLRSSGTRIDVDEKKIHSTSRNVRASSPVLSQSERRGQSTNKTLSANFQPLNSGLLKPIRKSASVPENLKDKGLSKKSILKRSTSFFANLANIARRRSSSTRTNSTESFDGSKKCVSFSADTSFHEGRPGKVKKTALHEAKIYKKGVLQDRNNQEDISRIAPVSWEEPFGGPEALLRAAQEADENLLETLASALQKSGIRNVDVNAVDSSGRSAASYIAGNGNSKILEICLSLPGADVNLSDNEGNAPLHFAAQAGQTDCLNVLLRCPSIEIDSRNALGFTPLMKAALQGRTKCAKILLFAGANPTLRDHGRGLRAEQWARFCGRYMCAEIIERFARHRLLEKTTSCRWGSEPELAAKVLQGKVLPIPITTVEPDSAGFRTKIRKIFRTKSNTDRTFSIVAQLTTAALCASSPILPKFGEAPPAVKSLLRPINVPQLR